MAVLASSIINDAAKLLHDPDFVHWPREELLGWCSAAEREIVSIKPDAYVEERSYRLEAGTYQSIPEDAVGVVRLKQNMGPDGQTPGTYIRLADRDQFIDQNPDAYQEPANAEVEYYFFDKNDPRHFEVFPEQPETDWNWIKGTFPVVPPVLEKSDTSGAEYDVAIHVGDIYEQPMLNYVMFRAYSKDSDASLENARAAANYFSLFATSLGKKEQVEKQTEPKAGKE